MEKIAAIWARVSTPGQAEPSLDSQVTRARAKLENAGYVVPAERILAVDWSSLDLFSCPDFQNLLRWIRHREIKALGILDRDRLTAEGIQRLIFLSDCKEAGIELIICQGPPILDEDEGQLIELALALGKKRSVLRARQGSKDGLHDRALKRRLPTSKHKVCGYQWEGERRLVPDDNWPIAKLILDMLLGGNTLDGIIAEFIKRGILSPTGLPEWNKATLSAIAHNPVYAGRYYALKKQAVPPIKRRGDTYGNSSQRKLPLEEAHYIPEIEIVNPPLTWEQRTQILDQLARHQKLAQRNAKREYLLRGFIFCGTHRGKKGEPRRYHGQPKRDTYYYCCPVGGCPHPYIPGPELDDYMEDIVTGLLVNSEDQILKVLESRHNLNIAQEKLHAELASIRAEYDRRINALADLEIRHAMLKTEGKTYRQEAYTRAVGNIEIRCEWLKNRENVLLDQLAQLGHADRARATLEVLMERFVDRLGNMSTKELRDLLSILNLEIIVSPEKCPEFDPYKPEYYWLDFCLGIPVVTCEDAEDIFCRKMDEETTHNVTEVVLASPERG